MKRKKKDFSKIMAPAVLIAVAVAFAWALKDGDEPQRQPEPDMETGRIEWASPAAAQTSTPTTAPTATNKPTPTPEPTATNTPTPAPTATNTPTPAPTRKTVALERGKPGNYKTPADGTHRWKPWAWYTAITATDSPQWRLQQIAKTDENGLRIVKDPNGVERFCIAMEPAWAGGTSKDIGRCVDLVMESGAVLHCVLADTKKVENSKDRAGVYGKHGELAEFLVDGTKLNPAAKRSGTVSSIGGAFSEEATEVRVFDFFIDGFGG